MFDRGMEELADLTERLFVVDESDYASVDEWRERGVIIIEDDDFPDEQRIGVLVDDLRKAIRDGLVLANFYCQYRGDRWTENGTYDADAVAVLRGRK